MARKPQQTGDGRYLVQLRDPHTGKRIPIRGATEAEVITRAERIRQVWRDQRAGLPLTQEGLAYVRTVAEGHYTAERAWNEYTEGRPEIRAIWPRHFAKAFGGCMLCDLTDERLKAWEQSKLASHAPKTIKLHFDLLKACVRRHIPSRLSSIPWGAWKPSGQGKVRLVGRQWAGSIERVGALLLVARQHDAELATWGPQHLPDMEARLTVASYCGLRQGELGGLGWDDLDIDGPAALMHVRHAVKRDWRTRHPDWTRPLECPKDRVADKLDPPQRLNAIAVRALVGQRALLCARGLYRPTGPVFPDRRGEWRRDPECIDVERLQGLVSRAWPDWPAERVQAFCAHSLRHTFSTLETAALIFAGGNLRDVASRTRHRDLGVLQGYIHATGEGLAAPLVPEPPNLPALGQDMSAPPSVALLTSEVARVAEHARQVDDIERRQRGRGADFRGSFEAWVRAGRPGDVPRDVQAQAHRSYHRARQDYLRRGVGAEEALAHARASRYAYLARWRQYVKSRDGAAVLASAHADAADLARAADVLDATGAA